MLRFPCLSAFAALGLCWPSLCSGAARVCPCLALGVSFLLFFRLLLLALCARWPRGGAPALCPTCDRVPVFLRVVLGGCSFCVVSPCFVRHFAVAHAGGPSPFGLLCRLFPFLAVTKDVQWCPLVPFLPCRRFEGPSVYGSLASAQ